MNGDFPFTRFDKPSAQLEVQHGEVAVSNHVGSGVKMRMGEIPGVPGDFQIRTNAEITPGGNPDDTTLPSWGIRMGKSAQSDDFAVVRRVPLSTVPGAGFGLPFQIDANGQTNLRTAVGAGAGSSNLLLVNVEPGHNEAYGLQVINGGALRFFANGDARASLSPTGDLAVAGLISGRFADVAERFETTVSVSTGDALVADPMNPGKLTVSTKPRDPSFAGVVSASPGLTLGS